MEFKQIDCTDVELLSRFFVENNVPKITSMFTAFPLTREIAHWIACEPHQDRFYIALQNGEITGFSMLRGWDEGFSVPSFGIFIDHRKHGFGIGKELLDHTIEAAQKIGCKKIRLSVYASNQIAYKIYENRGFTEIERLAIEHNGLPDQRIVMLKEL